MRTASPNKIPMWARFLAILLGIPLVVALMRFGLERKFERLTALVLATVSLLILWFVFRGVFASRRGPVSTSEGDKNREFSKFQGVMFAFFAVTMLLGAGIGFYGAFTSDSSPVWLRTACGMIGLIGLLLAFIFTVGSVQGFRRLTSQVQRTRR